MFCGNKRLWHTGYIFQLCLLVLFFLAVHLVKFVPKDIIKFFNYFKTNFVYSARISSIQFIGHRSIFIVNYERYLYILGEKFKFILNLMTISRRWKQTGHANQCVQSLTSRVKLFDSWINYHWNDGKIKMYEIKTHTYQQAYSDEILYIIRR